MNVYAHGYARKYLSSGKGLNYSDPQKRAIFEYCDWLVERPLDPAEATARAELDRLRGLGREFMEALDKYAYWSRSETTTPQTLIQAKRRYDAAEAALRAAVQQPAQDEGE